MSAVQMSRFATDWSETDIAQLRELWGKGFSASQIAKELGYSRDAVLGRVFRLKLPKRREAHHGQKSDRAVRPMVSECRPAIKAAPVKKRTPKGDKSVSPDAVGAKILKSEIWKPLPGTSPVPLMERTGCRWPIDGEAGAALFCNGAVEGSGSYCCAHEAVATRSESEGEE